MNNIMNYSTSIRRCTKIARTDKFKQSQVWWSNQFKELEAGIKVPPYRKLSELKKVFSEEELLNLTRAGLEYQDDVHDAKKRFKKGPFYKIKRRTFASSVYIPTRRCNLYNKKPRLSEKLIDFCEKPRNEVHCWSTTSKILSISHIRCINKATKVEEMLAQNFEEYFNRDETVSPKDVDIRQIFLDRAKTLEQQLARNFEAYFNQINSVTPIEIDKETILQIFELNNSLPISKAIFVNLQEIPTVPDRIAIYLGVPLLATSCALKRELNRDLEVASSPPISHAFGTMLPVQFRRYKTSPNISVQWFGREIRHDELRTFAAVFEGILHLETTKRFVGWLRKHKEIDPPKYLQETCIKMRTSKKFYLIRKVSIISKCDEGTNCSDESDPDNNIMV